MKKQLEVPTTISRYRQALLIGSLVCLYIFVPLFLVLPMIDTINQTRSEIDANQQHLDSLVEREQKLKSLSKATLQANDEELSTAIQPSIDLPLILATVQQLAKDSQLTLGSFTLSSNKSTITVIPTQNGNQVLAFEFNVGLDGTMDNIQNFYSKLQSYAPLLSATSIQFTANKSTLGLKYYFELKTASVAPTPAQAENASEQPTTAELPPLPQLGPKENEALSKVQQLNPPVLTIQSSSQSGSKANPFQ